MNSVQDLVGGPSGDVWREWVVRSCHAVGLCAVVCASAIFGFLLNARNRVDPRVEMLLNGSGVVQQLEDVAGRRSEDAEQLVPLVAAAREFATYLNPPAPPAPTVPQARSQSPIRLAQAKEPELTLRPAFSTVGFKLVATSYYEGRPDKSMALLSEPGNGDAGRWVREGTQIGHFTVHEIRQGIVVLRDGDNTRELAVERTTLQRNLVKEVRPGTNQAKAVVQDSNDQN
jgi:hypothetical protein